MTDEETEGDLSPEDEAWCREYLARWADSVALDDDDETSG